MVTKKNIVISSKNHSKIFPNGIREITTIRFCNLRFSTLNALEENRFDMMINNIQIPFLTGENSIICL
jgi:two-component SAPR family response regulator